MHTHLGFIALQRRSSDYEQTNILRRLSTELDRVLGENEWRSVTRVQDSRVVVMYFYYNDHIEGQSKLASVFLSGCKPTIGRVSYGEICKTQTIEQLVSTATALSNIVYGSQCEDLRELIRTQLIKHLTKE